MSHMSQLMSLSLCLSRFLSQCLTSVSTCPIEKNGAQSQSGWKRASMEILIEDGETVEIIGVKINVIFF